MEAAHEFLKVLAIVLGVAAVTTVVFQRLKQPVVLGYIVAGLLVGPHLHWFPLNADLDTVHVLSELGIILLMFAIGLELTLTKLARVAPVAGVIGLVQVAALMCAGYYVGRAFGWTALEGLFAGAAIAISSTTIIAKVFDEQKVEPKLRELVYGVLIVEDIVAILLLATMSTVASGAGLDAMELAITTGKLVGFLVAMIVVGIVVVPRLMRFVIGLNRPETTVVTSIGLCFGFASAAAAMHYSVALGAFVAGMLISESGEGATVEHLIVPVRDMFAAIFFVSVGMLIEPALVIDNWLAVIVLSVVVVFGKILGVTVGSLMTGTDIRTGVKAGMSLAQIGEFSFIIAGLGLTLGATRPFLYPVAIAVSAITTLTTPTLVRSAASVAEKVEARLPARMRGLIELYGEWVHRIRTEPRSPTASARIRRLLVLLVIDEAAILGLFAGSARLHDLAETQLEQRFGLSELASTTVFAASAVIVSIPFTIGLVRVTRALSLALTGIHGDTENPKVPGEGEVGVGEGHEGAGPTPAWRRSLALTLQVGFLTALGMFTLAVAEPFLPAAFGPALLALLGVVALIAVRHTMTRFETDVRTGTGAMLDLFKEQLHVPESTRVPHDSTGH